MFKLTEIHSNISNLISKYSLLILSFGYVLLGILIFFFPTELSKKAGIAMFIVGVLFVLLRFRKRKNN
jgi:uncharacterized membrane protein